MEEEVAEDDGRKTLASQRLSSRSNYFSFRGEVGTFVGRYEGRTSDILAVGPGGCDVDSTIVCLLRIVVMASQQ